MSDQGPQSTYKRRRALLAHQRRHRRGAAGNTMTAADQLELENSVKDSILEMILHRSVPLLAWVLWMLLGTIFYVYYDGYGWMIGFYISANIGCGIGWSAPYDTPRHNDLWSKLFSSIHVSIGQIFVGIAVLYIAEQLMEDKESWMISILQKKTQTTKNLPWWSKLWAKVGKFKIVFILLFWVVIGIIFGATSIEEWTFAESVDFVLSTLAKCGYRKIPNHSAPWKFFFVGLYSLFGIPLTVITLGFIVSFTLAGSEERSLFENIMVAVTPQEIEVMKSVGIGLEENVIQKQDFIVLMVVRIGAAHPDIIVRINEKFKSLDRKKLGKISYDDIVFRGRDIMKSKSETLRKIFIRRVSTQPTSSSSTSKRNSIMSRAVHLGNAAISPELKQTFYRATKRASAIFPSMNFKKLVHHPVDIDEHYQPSDSEEGGENNEDEESGYPMKMSPSPSSGSRSMSKFQLSLSHSTSKVAPLPEIVGERTLTASFGASAAAVSSSNISENKESEITNFTSFDQPTKFEESYVSSSGHRGSLHDFDTVSQQSEQLVGIEENQDEDSSDSESTSDQSQNYHRQIQPYDDNVTSPHTPPPHVEDHEHPPTEGELESHDQFSNDPQVHFHQRRKPVRISRALRHQLEIKKEKELLSTMNIRDRNLLQKIKEYLYLRFRHSHFLFVAAWMLWLMEGTLFYTLYEKTTFYRGYFLCVTVGHGLFWDKPSDDPVIKTFSIFHIIIGAILISCSLSIIAREVAESKKLWYVDAIRKQAILEATHTDEIWDDIVAHLQYWGPKFFIPVLFLTWEALGIIWSCACVGWSFVDAFYFVSSGLTGAGMWLIPKDSPSWYYFFTAVYVTLGAPLMAIALGQFADFLVNMAPNYDLEEQMKARVTDEELDTMKACGMENGDGFIDASEFVILILVRIHAVNPELISVIEERFVDLDADNSGTLSYEELTQRTNQMIFSQCQHQLVGTSGSGSASGVGIGIGNGIGIESAVRERGDAEAVEEIP